MFWKSFRKKRQSRKPQSKKKRFTLLRDSVGSSTRTPSLCIEVFLRVGVSPRSRDVKTTHCRHKQNGCPQSVTVGRGEQKLQTGTGTVSRLGDTWKTRG